MVSRAMRRLLRIREMEEEEGRSVLEAARLELRLLEAASSAVRERERKGRRLLGLGVQEEELLGRLAGHEEIGAATRQAQVLNRRIDERQAKVTALEEAFLVKRIERRQAEALIEENEWRDARKAGHKAQQSLDEWYGAGFHRKSLVAASLEDSPGNCTEAQPSPSEDFREHLASNPTERRFGSHS